MLALLQQRPAVEVVRVGELRIQPDGRLKGQLGLGEALRERERQAARGVRLGRVGCQLECLTARAVGALEVRRTRVPVRVDE